MTEKNEIEILKNLVSFDTTSSKSNLDLIEFIKNYLNEFNIESTLLHDNTNEKANLYATIGPKDVSGIILSGHTDVVPINKDSWDYDPFNLTQIDDKFFGRGCADMKGFLALVLSRVPIMVQANLKKPIHLAFSHDEEVGCVGVKKLLDHIHQIPIKPEFCIVGEPTSMEVVTSHKGKCAYKVNVKGLASHSGQAPLGVNAISYAAQLLLFISELAKEKSIKGPFDKEFEIPYTTLHTGVISGGKALNIVPDFCEFEFEIRYLENDKPLDLISKIKKYAEENILPEMKKTSNECSINIEEKISYPSFSIKKDSGPVSFMQKLLQNQITKKVIFGSEAGLYVEKLSVPTVVCGPGSIQQAHKSNEYISQSQLESCGKFLDNLIINLS